MAVFVSMPMAALRFKGFEQSSAKTASDSTTRAGANDSDRIDSLLDPALGRRGGPDDRVGMSCPGDLPLVHPPADPSRRALQSISPGAAGARTRPGQYDRGGHRARPCAARRAIPDP